MKQKMTLLLPVDLLEAARQQAEEQGDTLSAFTRKLIKKALAENTNV
jgi:hypothetical protein